MGTNGLPPPVIRCASSDGLASLRYEELGKPYQMHRHPGASQGATKEHIQGDLPLRSNADWRPKDPQIGSG